MFEVKEAFSKGPAGDTLMVIDEERDVWLQYVGGMGSEPGKSYKLVWKGQEIGFDVFYNHGADENGFEFILKEIFHFGGSTNAQWKGGIKPWRPVDESEFRAAKLLAIEALLAFGDFYDGHKRPDGFSRIKFENHHYIKSDFGMP